MSLKNNSEKSYFILLGTGCVYQERINGRYHETDEFKSINVPFKFASKELYNWYDGVCIGYLSYYFSEFIQDDHKGYFMIEDILEPVRDISEDDAAQLGAILCVNGYPDKNGDVDVSYWKTGMGIKSAKK